MSDPLALVPLAAAAHGGRIESFEARQLVAAGLTLLQRSAWVVRALSGKRSAILLPPGPAFLVALAASEGRGAVLIDPLTAPQTLARQFTDTNIDPNIGAVFTLAAYADVLPPHLPRILLDDAPARARVVHEHEYRDVDLGSHVGLPLAGEADVEGREEEAVLFAPGATREAPPSTALTHRDVLAAARAIVSGAALGAHDRSLALLPFAHPFGLTAALIAPLVAGAQVTVPARFDLLHTIELASSREITIVVGLTAIFAEWLAVIERRGNRLHAPTIRLGLCGDVPPPRLRDRWRDATGAELVGPYARTDGA